MLKRPGTRLIFGSGDGSVIARTSSSLDIGWEADYVYVTYKFLQKWILQYGIEGVCAAYGTLILDEIHVLPPTTIVLLGLLRLALVSVDFSLVLMSATAAIDMFVDYFQFLSCAVFHIPGRRFNVLRAFVQAPWGMEVAWAAKLVSQRWGQFANGVLIFLAGAAEMVIFVTILKSLLDDDKTGGFYILDVPYFILKSGDTARALKSWGQRLILATEAAAMSVTLDGIDLTVNTGIVKRQRTLLCGSMLFPEVESKPSWLQKEGRTGRDAPGEVIHLQDPAGLAECDARQTFDDVSEAVNMLMCSQRVGNSTTANTASSLCAARQGQDHV